MSAFFRIAQPLSLAALGLSLLAGPALAAGPAASPAPAGEPRAHGHRGGEGHGRLANLTPEQRAKLEALRAELQHLPRAERRKRLKAFYASLKKG